MQPSAALSTLRPDLTASLEEFDLMVNADTFIGSRVLPTINVARKSGTYGQIPLEQLLQNRETRRAPGAAYNRATTAKFEVATFACKEHGVEEVVDDTEAAMYGDYLDAEVFAAQRAQHQILLNRERRIAAAVFNTTTWTGSALTTAASVPWSTIATATPLTDVEAAVRKVVDGSGLWPNALILSRYAFRNLRNCAQILDRIKYQGFQDVRATAITANALAQLFDLDMVLVAGGVRNSAAEGQAATVASIWSNTQAMVCRIPMSGDVREPGIGRVFHWNADGSMEDGLVESYRDETVRSDVVRVRHDVDETIMLPQAGHLLTSL